MKLAALLISFLFFGALPTLGQTIEPYHARTIQVDSARSTRPHTAGGVQVHQGKSIEPYKAQEIRPDKAKEVEQHKAKEIEPYKAKEIQSHRAKEAGTGNAGRSTLESDKDARLQTDAAATAKPDGKPAEYFFGVFHTRVPGAVWQTPSGISGYDRLHTSAGALAGDLRINKDGTFTWDSYGGKSGTWIRGDADYPVVLIDKAENKRWKVGYDPKHTGQRDIIIWDGYVWYDGKKAS